MVGLSGLEPLTSRLSGVRSNRLSYRPLHNISRTCSVGGDEENRTPDPLLARQVLSHLSYAPVRVLSYPQNPIWKLAKFTLRKEVIQPHLPIRLPCYDFTPVIAPTLGGYFLAVSPPTSGVNDFRGVTGGVYKARERIHRSMLTCDY